MYTELKTSLVKRHHRDDLIHSLETLLDLSLVHVDIQGAEAHEQHAPSRQYCGLFHMAGVHACQVHGGSIDTPIRLDPGDLLIASFDAHGDLKAIGLQISGPSLIRGRLYFTGGWHRQFHEVLPPWFVIRPGDAGDVYRRISNAMIEVSQSSITGRGVILNKLAEILFTIAICHYAKRSDANLGLFTAFSDRRISKVLNAIHEDPGRGWSVQTMAALACMSRSSFTQRFTQLMKMPPGQYITYWRMHLAERLLQDPRLSVADVAEQVGYASKAAFYRLFKRIQGMCPGEMRAVRAATTAGDEGCRSAP